MIERHDTKVWFTINMLLFVFAVWVVYLVAPTQFRWLSLVLVASFYLASNRDTIKNMVVNRNL